MRRRWRCWHCRCCRVSSLALPSPNPLLQCVSPQQTTPFIPFFPELLDAGPPHNRLSLLGAPPRTAGPPACHGAGRGRTAVPRRPGAGGWQAACLPAPEVSATQWGLARCPCCAPAWQELAFRRSLASCMQIRIPDSLRFLGSPGAGSGNLPAPGVLSGDQPPGAGLWGPAGQCQPH